MPFPKRDDIQIGILLDLPDDRRAKKPWLPPSDKDATEGRVVLNQYPKLDGYWPACVRHGAMLSVAAENYIWRCGEEYCGVGAIYRRR
ncbi:MAG: hypothetical protein HYT72_04265 [Candidatus Aenigmarchaeota archaeon]|nr:hypothetical protein [Candidatus Aenigmarchaeota archaeon]